MKVLQINKYSSIKGGTEIVLFNTIKLLEKEGYEVVLFSTDEGEIVHNPTYTISYPKNNDSFFKKMINIKSFFYNRKAMFELKKLIEKENPNIAHVHLYHNSFSSSILSVLKEYKIPVVMTLHDYREICPSYLLMDRNKNICEKCVNGNYFHCLLSRCSKGSFFDSVFLTLEMYYRRSFFKVEKYVNLFICVSQFSFQKHLKFNKAITDKAVVLSNPVEITDELSSSRGEYILYYGRLSEEKGLSTLFSAMAQLPYVKLKIAGRGNVCPDNGFSSNIEMLGFKQKDELKLLIRHAQYVVVPSESLETFGLSCVESLELGTPVIASNIGALPEIIKHGENGFLFTPKDVEGLRSTINMALGINNEEYRTLCWNAKEGVKKFSEDKYIKGLLSIYNQVINNQ